MKIKKLWDTTRKKFLCGIIAGATILGTYSGNEGGLPPIYTKKVGKSAGINISCVTTFMPGSEFYGLSISGSSMKKGGTINGIDLSVGGGGAKEGGKINGLEVAIGFNTDMAEGKNTDKIIGRPSVVNGLQASLCANRARAGNCVQLGLYNEIEYEDGTKKRGLLLNYGFKKKDKKVIEDKQ